MAGDQTQKPTDGNNKSSSSSSSPETVLHTYMKANDHDDGAIKPNPDEKAATGKKLNCENIKNGSGDVKPEVAEKEKRNNPDEINIKTSCDKVISPKEEGKKSKVDGTGEEDVLAGCLSKLNIGSTKKEDNDRVKAKAAEEDKYCKKKLLVFNLNGLLLHRVHVKDRYAKKPNRSADAGSLSHTVYKRPYVDEFLEFCFKRFEVGIWSSAMEKNMDHVIRSCFKGVAQDVFLFTWDQVYCTDSGFKSLENKFKPLFFKELRRVWNSYGNSVKGPFSAKNTLLIDDAPYKALLNPPNTGVFPTTYDVEDSSDDFLNPMGRFASWLDGLAKADDVPSYVEANRFGQPPVKEGHADWTFYSKILRAWGR